MKRKSSFYIKDIIDAIAKIEEFVENMDFDDFIKDDKTSSAVRVCSKKRALLPVIMFEIIPTKERRALA